MWGLIGVLSYAAWAAWFHRQIIATTAIVTGTLLLCDAWFDIITSLGHGDQWVTLLTGFGGELPLAIFFFWLYRRIVLASLATIHQRLGDGPSPQRLREAQILFLRPRGAPAPAAVPSADLPDPRAGCGQSETQAVTGHATLALVTMDVQTSSRSIGGIA